MTEQEIQNSIDNYLLHKMTIAEQEAFEKEMENDSDLMQKVEIQQLLVDEMKYKRDFERIITKKPVIHFTLKKTMVVVWSAAAIFAGAMIINRTMMNNRMDNLYTEMYTSPDELRGTPNQQEADLYNVIKLLDQNQPEQAQTALLKLYNLSSDYPYYEAVRWYLALTELKLHHKAEAKKYLNELIDSEFYGVKVKGMLEKL